MLTPKSLSLSIDALARKNLGRDWGLYATLLDHWREIVGEEYAETVTPVKVSFPKARATEGPYRTDGILTVRAPHGLAMALSYRTGQIQERIAGFFGYPAIAKIELETYYPDHKDKPEPCPIPPEDLAALQAQLADIEDPDLRKSLEELGLSILREGKS